VVATVFNGPRKDKKEYPIEGEWVAEFAKYDPSIQYVLLSASPILKSDVESGICDDESADEFGRALSSQRLFESTVPKSVLGLPNVQVLPFTNPDWRKECPGMLAFIVENYNSLADVSIFLHGFPFDHNTHLADLLKELFDWNRRTGLPFFDFMYANDWLFTRCYRNPRNNSIGEMLGLDAEYFPYEGTRLSRQGCYLPKFCCAQFLVSREAIQRRPRSFYRLALKLVNELPYHPEMGPCAEMEMLWHAIFRWEAHFTGLTINEFVYALHDPTGFAY